MGSELGIDANSRPQLQLGAVGIWWACWAGIWTCILLVGMTYLFARRQMPILKIRGLGLSLLAITLLHLYWISVQLGYIIGPLAPGDTEYWIMGTYLPLGIGLFHASNCRFLHIAQAQKKFARDGKSHIAKPNSRRGTNGIAQRFRRLSYTKQTFIVVGLAMGIQILLTILMYLISRKWHSSWGIYGTEVTGSEMEQKTEMGRGWEWWPSVLWQFFWAWIVAPITLWRARGIHDTQGWRFQTVSCALANLHATPMWLIALYVPAMEPVNKYWIPPQWIAVSIWMMEIFTVFLPCWQVLRYQHLRQETLDSIAQWEQKNKMSGQGAKSLNSASTMVESMLSGWKSINDSIKTYRSGESILTMSALEYVLERNPAPLQKFSALRDFSGENIAFLTSVSEWKSSLLERAQYGASQGSDHITTELVREPFNRALRIYVDYISPSDADFPINISSQDLKKLEHVFEHAARALFGDRSTSDPVSPFDRPETLTNASPSACSSSHNSEKAFAAGTSSEDNDIQFWGEIPAGFDEKVFDDAEKSIKYLVLTNTWPKFVRDRRSSMDSFDSEAGHVLEMARQHSG